jgi:hypothetical protein
LRKANSPSRRKEGIAPKRQFPGLAQLQEAIKHAGEMTKNRGDAAAPAFSESFELPAIDDQQRSHDPMKTKSVSQDLEAVPLELPSHLVAS